MDRFSVDQVVILFLFEFGVFCCECFSFSRWW